MRMMMMALLISLGIAGCGGDEHGLVTVRGRILYKGQPAGGAVVSFHRVDPTPLPADKVPPLATGVADEDGNFRLESGDWGRGALPGEYKVLVTWPDRDAWDKLDAPAKAKLESRLGRDTARRPADRLKGRYQQLDRPILKADVKPQTNDLAPFDLTD